MQLKLKEIVGLALLIVFVTVLLILIGVLIGRLEMPPIRPF